MRLLAGALMAPTTDDAYYSLWSQRPALGYYDHPPLIAWWIWLGRHVAGEGPLGIRLASILGSALITLVVFDLARLCELGERVAVRAALWFNATLLFGILGLLAWPDVPTTLFWSLTLWSAMKALRGAGAWWLAAGAAAGLACLSKYSGLFLAPGLVLWLATSREGRRALLTPWPWLAALVAVGLFAGNIAWNAAHHWETFAKQFGRVVGAGFAPLHLAELVGAQFLLLNPAIAVFAGRGLGDKRTWPFVATAAPFVLYLVIHSLHDSLQAWWPAPLYPGLAICAAAAAERVRAGGFLAGLRSAAPALGFSFTGIVLALACVPLDRLGVSPDPGAALHGWPAFERAVEARRLGAGAAWVGAASYGLASDLTVGRQLAAPATEVVERARYTFETPANRADFTRPGLVIDEPKKLAKAAPLATCFAHVAQLPDLRRAGQRYALFLVSGPLKDIERNGC